MSQRVPVEDKVEETKIPVKCRIPTKSVSRPKASGPPLRSRVTNEKSKINDQFSTNTRYGQRNMQRGYRIDEPRPKSANRVKEELGLEGIQNHTRSARLDCDRKPTARSPAAPVTPRNTCKQSLIIVPMMSKNQKLQNRPVNTEQDLPSQETIQKHEDLELLQQAILFEKDSKPIHELEIFNTQSDGLLKTKWQDTMTQYEKMKNDLSERQKAIIEQYVNLKNMYQMLETSGQEILLPPVEELRVMNINQFDLEKLMKIFNTQHNEKIHKENDLNQSVIDTNKLNKMPAKLIATCEETLQKRKDIIDWFEKLRSTEKSVSMGVLAKKTNEFMAENDMLKTALDDAKEEMSKELNGVIEFVKKTINDTMALQLRAEEMTYQLSELNSQNSDLRKQIHNHDHFKSYSIRNRIEELEKELKEEKCKRLVLKNRLNGAGGQVKINADRATQLEAALELARSQNWNYERTIQQLNEQNKKLREDFDAELKKLTDSIGESTNHLEEISDARQKLQAEKEDLEKRLGELSNYYNESLSNLKNELDSNRTKLIETEKNYEQEAIDKKGLELKVEILNNQLLEADAQQKVLQDKLQENEKLLNEVIEYNKMLEPTKKNLDSALAELEEHKSKISKQEELIKTLEWKAQDTNVMQDKLKDNLMSKEEYIIELEQKQSILEKQLHDGESKMESYEKQLSALKSHIHQLKEDFGEFESLSELHDMINQQQGKLHEVTKQNNELVEALQNKDKVLDRHIDNLAELEHLLEQREEVVKILSQKDKEQSEIIVLLQNKLQKRSQSDISLNQEISEKNAEIESLLGKMEAKILELRELEKKNSVLEEKLRDYSMQRMEDEDRIKVLEQKIEDYNTYLEDHNFDISSYDVDSLIKIFEDELDTSFDTIVNNKDLLQNKYSEEHTRNKYVQFDYNKRNNNQKVSQSSSETKPEIKNKGNNYGVYMAKKCYASNKPDHIMGDNRERKKMVNIDSQKNFASHNPGSSEYVSRSQLKESLLSGSGSHDKTNVLAKNIYFLSPNRLQDEKRNKMFRLTGHKL